MTAPFDPAVFQADVFQTDNASQLFQVGVFQPLVFQAIGTPATDTGFRNRHRDLPQYVDGLADDEVEAIFLMSAGDIFGA